MRLRQTQHGGSLDSLLDTMTNVVGILVILLAVTQLGVGDAVKRIVSTRGVSASASLNVTLEKLDIAEKDADSLRALLDQLREQWRDVGRRVANDQADLQQITQLIEALKKELSMKPDAKIDAAEVKKIIDDRGKHAHDLESKISSAQAELAKLKAILDTTPQMQVPAPKIITLPNPRPAPPEATPILFICREGRILPVDMTQLELVAQTGVQQAGGTPNAKGEIDCDAVVNYFETHALGDKYFRVRIKIHNYTPYMILDRKPDAGETVEQLSAPQSDYQQAVRAANKTTQYARYLVWPDSFETYIAARAIAADADMMAGWEPMTLNSEWSVRLEGNIKCKGRPPEPPPPPDKTIRPPDSTEAAPNRVDPPPIDTID
ncbi:MAG: hypothetical protein GC162_06945 [Planctomycetes bacterium]|nr:hypothetical protein [Planctomycetota bacterium]